MGPQILPELTTAYDDLGDLVTSLTERDAWLPTGCLGMHVRDLVRHLLGDAQRALVALATPSIDPPDRTAISYWLDSPGPDDVEWRQLRALRTLASAYSLAGLQRDWNETSRAVLTLAHRAGGDDVVATQGHTLTINDLLTTLVVEASLHHLDLTTHLPRSGPAAGPLGVVRRTLDGLLGEPAPAAWSTEQYARLVTGRVPLTERERVALGDLADRLPLIR